MSTYSAPCNIGITVSRQSSTIGSKARISSRHFLSSVAFSNRYNDQMPLRSPFGLNSRKFGVLCRPQRGPLPSAEYPEVFLLPGIALFLNSSDLSGASVLYYWHLPATAPGLCCVDIHRPSPTHKGTGTPVQGRTYSEKEPLKTGNKRRDEAKGIVSHQGNRQRKGNDRLGRLPSERETRSHNKSRKESETKIASRITQCLRQDCCHV